MNPPKGNQNRSGFYYYKEPRHWKRVTNLSTLGTFIPLTSISSSVQFNHSVVFDSLRPLEAHQASLSITNSRSLPKLMSVESVMPSNHLILCHLLFLLPSIFPNIKVFSFFNINLFILIGGYYFTILYWFCHTSTWICHRCTRVPHHQPPTPSLPVPSHWVIPVHQPQASSIMHRTWTGDLFHIWYYTCFNAILPNHPTLSLSHRVRKTILYICVSCCLAYRVIIYHLSKFHTYVLVTVLVFFFLAYFTLYNQLQFHPPH